MSRWLLPPLSGIALVLVGLGVGRAYGLAWGLAVPGALLWLEAVAAAALELSRSRENPK